MDPWSARPTATFVRGHPGSRTQASADRHSPSRLFENNIMPKTPLVGPDPNWISRCVICFLLTQLLNYPITQLRNYPSTQVFTYSTTQLLKFSITQLAWNCKHLAHIDLTQLVWNCQHLAHIDHESIQERSIYVYNDSHCFEVHDHQTPEPNGGGSKPWTYVKTSSLVRKLRNETVNIDHTSSMNVSKDR